MSRAAGLEDAEVFRAVIDVTRPPHPDSDETAPVTYSNVYGPYRTVGAARAAKTRESYLSPYWRHRGHTASGRVERAALDWQPVE